MESPPPTQTSTIGASPSPGTTQALLDAIRALVVIVDGQGRVLATSAQTLDTTGWSASDLRGRPLEALLLSGLPAALSLDEGVPLVAPLRGADDRLHPARWSVRRAPPELGAGEAWVLTGEPLAAPPIGDAVRTLIDHLPDAIAVHREGRVVHVNPAMLALLGGERLSEVLDRDVLSFVRRAEAETAAQRLARVRAGLSTPFVDLHVVRLDGVELKAEVCGMPVTFEGQPAGVVLVRDVTAPRAAEEARRTAEERYALAARSAGSGLWEWNALDNAVFLSPRLKQLLGYDDQELTIAVDDPLALFHTEDRPRLQETWARISQGEQEFEVEGRIRHRNGSWRWFLTRGIAARGEDGRLVRVAGSCMDVSELRQVEAQLQRNTLYDRLTGLPARANFLERLRRCFDRPVRPEGGRGFAVFFLDVDRFKVVNDSLGHGCGDEVLVEVSRRLQRCVRLQDTIARFGGDEFTILVNDLNHPNDASRVAERVHAQFLLPIRVQGHELFTTVSIGIALDDGGYQGPEELLRDADNAMFRAKAQGRAQHVVFDRKMHEAALHHLELQTDMHRALEREEFLVHYQPIIQLSDGRITGFEALLRWRHPKRKLVMPSEFIPFAEESGLIVPLGLWVLQKSCRDLRAMTDAVPGTGELSVAVNLSARQFQQVDLVERIKEILDEEHFPARRLKLEVTESTLMGDPYAARAMLERLRELEIRVCIDDFGTGYSSLSQLRFFQVDTLKIDRSFVTMLDPKYGGEAPLARSILSLAHQMGLDAIAEGVETLGQLDALRAASCTYAQGYLFERPLSASAARALLRTDPRW